jgi:chromatin remodeling complex protein RSC6
MDQISKPAIHTYEKVFTLLEEHENDLRNIKVLYDSMKSRQKVLRNALIKIENKISKKASKIKTNRKPCGFARPTKVSDEMCEFMNVPTGTLISRTDVTKSLIKYIKENQLTDEENRRKIKPDETLYKLFGEEARTQVITYFTMQKFMNIHFPKN